MIYKELIYIWKCNFSYVRIWDLSNDDEPEAYGNISDGLFCSYSNSGKLLTVGYVPKVNK